MTPDQPRSLRDWIPYLWSTFLFPNPSSAETAVRKWSLLLVLVLPAVLLYPTMNFHLLEPDEGRYAQIPCEMLRTGEWVVPHLQGMPYLDKPPLMYWLVMLSYSIFGVSESAARLIPAMAVHGTILAVYLLGRRSVGERSARWAAILLGVAPGFIGMGRLLILDGLLTFLVTTAVLCLFESIRGSSWNRRWWYLAAVLAGLGVLTKGPISLLLLAPPIWLYRRLSGRRVSIPIRHVVGFLAVALAVNAPWYTAIFLREPIFLKHFFWDHNIMRFVKPFDHLQPVWFYVPIVLVGMLPGTLLLYAYFRNLGSGDPECRSQRTAEAGFWLLSGAWCVFFFSMSGCKLPTYVLPAFPCMALALGDFVARTPWSTAVRTRIGLATCGLLLLGTNYVVLPWYAERRSPMGIPEVAQKLHDSKAEAIYCFPRNVDSVAFYTERNDLRSVRTKASQELIESIMDRKRTVVLFTHRHSLQTLKLVLPPFLKVTEEKAVRHPSTGYTALDRLVNDGPWGLCDVAVIERVN